MTMSFHCLLVFYVFVYLHSLICLFCFVLFCYVVFVCLFDGESQRNLLACGPSVCFLPVCLYTICLSVCQVSCRFGVWPIFIRAVYSRLFMSYHALKYPHDWINALEPAGDTRAGA
jgi:hypothetical protein